MCAVQRSAKTEEFVNVAKGSADRKEQADKSTCACQQDPSSHADSCQCIHW